MFANGILYDFLAEREDDEVEMNVTQSEISVTTTGKISKDLQFCLLYSL